MWMGIDPQDQALSHGMGITCGARHCYMGLGITTQTWALLYGAKN